MRLGEPTNDDVRQADCPVRNWHVVTADPCQHAASLPAWSQEYLQLSSGPFAGEIREASFGPVQVFQERIDQVVDEKANPRRDSYTVGVPVSVSENGLWQGRELKRDSMMLLRPNEELHFKTPRHSNILVTVVACCALDGFSELDDSTLARNIVDRPHVVEMGIDAARDFRSTLQQALTVSIDRPELLASPAIRNDLSDGIMNAILVALRDNDDMCRRSISGHSVQRAIVERSRAFVLANRERAITVTELCSYLHMSRRGLHHAFMNVLGINPVTFLRYVRLHEVRKLLLDAENRETISEIASRWGFWHMGMFGQYYKQLFHETPSETARRVRTDRYTYRQLYL